MTTHPALLSLGLSSEQLAAVQQIIADECDAVVERYRSANRERVRRFRSKQTNSSHRLMQVSERNVTAKAAGNVTRNVTKVPRNVTVRLPSNVTILASNVTPAKSLKVSRNFGNVTECNVSRGETYKEGGKGTSQVLFPTVRVPSKSAVAEITEVPDFPPAPAKQVPISTQQAQNPKTALYALAKAKFGERGGALVGRWFKQFPDHAQLLAFLTAATAKFPEETQPAIGYVVDCIKKRTADANRWKHDRELIQNWFPTRDRLLPPRDYSDPRERFYLKHPNDGRKVYMEPSDVFPKYDAFCLEHGIVEG